MTRLKLQDKEVKSIYHYFLRPLFPDSLYFVPVPIQPGILSTPSTNDPSPNLIFEVGINQSEATLHRNEMVFGFTPVSFLDSKSDPYTHSFSFPFDIVFLVFGFRDLIISRTFVSFVETMVVTRDSEIKINWCGHISKSNTGLDECDGIPSQTCTHD